MACVFASFPVVVINHPDKNNSRQKGHIWLTIPGYGPLPRKSKEEELETAGHSTPTVKSREQCMSVTQFKIPFLGNGATHNDRVFPHQLA